MARCSAGPPPPWTTLWTACFGCLTAAGSATTRRFDLHTHLHTAGRDGPDVRSSHRAAHHRARSKTVPFVNVKVIEGVFTSAQKQEMIAAITDTMVAIEGENLRGLTWVVVEEVRSGDWGIGGQGLGTADVKALQGQPVLASTAG